MMSDLDKVIEKHDAAVAAGDAEIWIGAEPTFTLRTSEAPEWLSQALGGEKEDYALRMARELSLRHPGSVILRSVGRQYGGEERPRWSIGLFERRDGAAVWSGPPDPVFADPSTAQAGGAQLLGETLARAFSQRHWHYRVYPAGSDIEQRLLVRTDGKDLDRFDADDPRLSRCSAHDEKTPDSGLNDSLAGEGFFLFVVGEIECAPGITTVRVDLPACREVDGFIECLAVLSQAASAAALPCLLLRGYPPPVDASVSWTTITPDPAVIEINQAPQPNLARFRAAASELYAVADELGLAPYRLQYNGTMSDSGGGGQFTVGGRTPASSPFFAAPYLLPRMVRYFNHHPALSYLFAPDYVGSASQSPRADEGVRDAFRELEVALWQLEMREAVTPEFLWASLAPFLADPSGNSHRSELNIEKLWNAGLPLRGCLGLLEFRAFRMPHSPRRALAVALLLRSVVAMLVQHDRVQGLCDWGDELHDRFALPYYLRRDLGSVLADLEHTGFGLDPSIAGELFDDTYRSRWSVDFAGCRLEIEQAIEFWPLVGDVASQERGGSRLVDSSTLRLQISLRRSGEESVALDGWQLRSGDYALPLMAEEEGELRLMGLRYRDFLPWRGLHPAIKPMGPVVLTLCHPGREEAVELSLHGWQPDGLPYNGLPGGLDEAVQRRTERLRSRIVNYADLPSVKSPPGDVLSGFNLDLRRLKAVSRGRNT